jgi:Rieske 2Fe-2S family protein
METQMEKFYDASETLNRGATPLPGSYYRSESHFQTEIERIFFEQWVYVGRAEQIPNPGDYFLQPLGGESLIIVRDLAGQVRAHYNVCRHRGTRLCTAETGHFNKSIQCPYHAWTYGLDGRLIGAPHMTEVAGFAKQDFPLHSLTVEVWEGFLFINLSPHPQPFQQSFAPLLDKFTAWNMTELRAAARIEYEVAANWKLIVENYSECYHCPLIHPELSARSDYLSGRNDLYEGNFLGGFMNVRAENHSMSMSGATSGKVLGQVSGEDLNRVYYYSIFPNMLLSLHPDYVMAHRLLPHQAGQTTVICEWFFDSEAMSQPDFNPNDAVEFWDITNRQDWQVCELSQLGVSSRAYTPGLYSEREGLAAAFTQEVRRVMAVGSD